MKYCGIDVSANTLDLALVDEKDKLIKTMKLTNRPEFFHKILHELIQHQVEEIGLESTGPYGEPISHFLYTHGVQVYTINPYRIKSFREMKIRKTSTDKRDSILIAQYMRLGEERHPYTPRSPLQSLTRLRFSLVDTLVAHKNELCSAVAMTFPGFFDLFGNKYNKTSLALLEYYSTADKIAKAPHNELLDLVRRASRGYYGSGFVGRLKKVAESSSDISSIESALRIRVLVSGIRFYEEKIKEVEEEIVKLAKESKEIEIIDSIRGIGITLAASIYAEIEDIKRFKKLKSLRGFTGTDPSVKESGKSVRGKSRFSKRGDKYLRRALWLASQGCIHHCEVFRVYFAKKFKQYKIRKKAVGAVLNKLMGVIFYLLKHKVLFDTGYEFIS